MTNPSTIKTKNKKTWNLCWTTESEKKEIDKIGSFSKFPKLTLLQGYRKALLKRTNMAGMDKTVLLKYVEEKIIKAGGKIL